MKIGESSVSMASTSSYTKYTSLMVLAEETARKKNSFDAATLRISLTKEELKEKFLEMEEEQKKQQEQREQQNLLSLQNLRKPGQAGELHAPSKENFKTDLMKRMLEALRRMRKGKPHNLYDDLQELKRLNKSFSSSSSQQTVSVLNLSSSASVSAQGQVSGVANSNVWTKTTLVSAFQYESESTAFQSTGMVRTADGREISFDISFEMSRSFIQQFSYLEQTDVILTDPLVINVDASVASVSDQKFYFDIDADGDEDDISYLGKGSGFLAYDKNGDGTINDGNELFGTKSGNGFQDLAAYDEDGNGWIDESDKIFENLKVWYKNDDGTDELISLKDAGVGAVYLGNVATQFHLNAQGTNQTNAVIQNSGIFLKESGEAGIIQHVDLAV